MPKITKETFDKVDELLKDSGWNRLHFSIHPTRPDAWTTYAVKKILDNNKIPFAVDTDPQDNIIIVLV